MVDERARDRDTLLLAAGELVRERVHLVREADEVQHLGHLPPDRRGALALHLQGVRDVLGGGPVRQQLEVLEDAADVAAQQRDLRALQPAELAAADDDLARGRLELLQDEPDRRSSCPTPRRRRRTRTRPCRSRTSRLAAPRRQARRSSSRSRRPPSPSSSAQAAAGRAPALGGQPSRRVRLCAGGPVPARQVGVRRSWRGLTGRTSLAEGSATEPFPRPSRAGTRGRNHRARRRELPAYCRFRTRCGGP